MAGAEKKNQPNDDQQEELERALDKGPREDLIGDMEENRNLTGSTTWETLDEDEDEKGEQRDRT